MIAPVRLKRWSSSGPATYWSSGSWIGSVARYRIWLAIVNTLKGKQVEFRSLTENTDTSTASGELLFHVFDALAQYERALIQERVGAGLAAAKRRGRFGGRPPAIVGEKRDTVVAALNGGMSKAAVFRNFGVKRAALIEFPLLCRRSSEPGDRTPNPHTH